MTLLGRIDRGVTRWLTAPEKNAAGRISLYRIIYGLYYLWLTPSLINRFQRYDLLTAREWDPVFSLRWFNPAPPDPMLVPILNGILVASLILLVIGLKTRWANLLVLVAGVALNAIHYSYTSKIDHADTFIVAYVPTIMLFANWSSCYSLDAILKRRAGKASVDPHDDSWRYIWPMRLILLLLALMYFGASYLKVTNGQWISDPQVMPNMFLVHSVEATASLVDPNPLNPIIASTPFIYLTLHVCALAFETFFCLSLINQRLRTFFLSTAIIFHAFNYYFFSISFIWILGVYLLFVDWQALVDRFRPRLNVKINPLPTLVLIGLAVGSASLGVLLWVNVNPLTLLIRPTPTVWIIATPLGLFFMIKNGLALARGGLVYLRQRRQRDHRTGAVQQNPSS